MQLNCAKCGEKGFTLKSKTDVFWGKDVSCLCCESIAYLPGSLLLLLKIIYLTIWPFIFLGSFYYVGLFFFIPLSVAILYGVFKASVLIIPVVFKMNNGVRLD